MFYKRILIGFQKQVKRGSQCGGGGGGGIVISKMKVMRCASDAV